MESRMIHGFYSGVKTDKGREKRGPKCGGSRRDTHFATVFIGCPGNRNEPVSVEPRTLPANHTGEAVELLGSCSLRLEFSLHFGPTGISR